MLCKKCWMEHLRREDCIPGSAVAIRKRKSRSLNREHDRAKQRRYMRERYIREGILADEIPIEDL